MKLELKHVVGYLPYRLRVKTGNGKLMRTLNADIDENFRDMITLNNLITGIGHKPILRPLSDIGEEKFTELWSNETDYESILKFIELDTETRLTSKFSFIFWELLYENMFDIHDLIEKGLAIDINTLK